MTRLLILFLGLALSRNTQRGTSCQATPELGSRTIRQVKTSRRLLFLLNKVGNTGGSEERREIRQVPVCVFTSRGSPGRIQK